MAAWALMFGNGQAYNTHLYSVPRIIVLKSTWLTLKYSPLVQVFYFERDMVCYIYNIILIGLFYNFALYFVKCHVDTL